MLYADTGLHSKWIWKNKIEKNCATTDDDTPSLIGIDTDTDTDTHTLLQSEYIY